MGVLPGDPPLTSAPFFLSLTPKHLLGTIVWIDQKFSGMFLMRVLREGELEERSWSLSFFIGPSATLLSPSLPRLNLLCALCPAFLVFTSAFKTPDVPLMFPSPPCTALSDAVYVTSECSATDFSRSCDNESPELPLILLFPLLD